MGFKWEFVSQQVDQRRDSLDYALEYLLKRESSINPFGVEVDRLPSVLAHYSPCCSCHDFVSLAANSSIDQFGLSL